MQQQLASMCKDMLALTPSQSVSKTALNKVKEELEQNHQQEIAELKFNFSKSIHIS